ncbi:MAG TPA: HlyD family efflux transporter periplasmic adaptor subunit [Thermoleophilia bacterium]|nr:HlyD family efflux transporter periplasmic adaptor subunit [Thermoleophilia bacterium]
MDLVRRIPIPFRRRLQYLRARVLSLAIWAAAVALVAALWSERSVRVDTPGMVEARQAMVAPGQNGTLKSVTVDLFDQVTASQVVARLDDSTLRAQLAVAESDVKRLEAKVRATEFQLKQEATMRDVDAFARTRTYAMRIERLRVDRLNLLIDLENSQVMLQGLAVSLDREKSLRQKNIVSDEEVDSVKYQHDALEKKIKATQAAITVIDGQIEEARAQEQGATPPAMTDDSFEVALGPVREEVSVQLKRVEELKVARLALVLTAPLQGVVSYVYKREGETVMAGDPVLAIADPRSMRIINYVEQGKPVAPAEGMMVEVRRRTRPMQVAQARIVKVAPHVEPVPATLLANPRMPVFALRVLVDMPFSMLVPADESGGPTFAPPRPGEVLDVRYSVPRRLGR